MPTHRVLNPGDIHKIHNFEYADSTAREGAGLGSGDVGKVARQLDDDTFWILVSASPVTWTEITSTGGGGTVTAAEGADGYLAFFTSSTGLAGDNDLFFDRVNNRLGVGTASPSYKLQVRAGGDDAEFRIGTTEGGAEMFMKPYFGSEARFGSTNNVPLVFYVNGSERGRWTTGGSLGIGVTSPGATLGVSGGVTIGTSYDTLGTPTSGMQVEGDTRIGYSSHTSAKLVVNGRVGVNTSAPDNNFTMEIVDGGLGASGVLRVTADDSSLFGFIVGNDTFSTTSNNGMAMTMGDDGTARLSVYGPGSSDLIFQTGGTTGGTLTNVGRFTGAGELIVGSGSTADAKLHVEGDGYFDGYLMPHTDNMWGLGTPDLRWRDLYLGPNSLHIVSKDTDGGRPNRTFTWEVTESGTLCLSDDGTPVAEFSSGDGASFPAGGGGGGAAISGTPVNNQIAIWTDASTIEGDADLVFDGTSLGIGIASPEENLHISGSAPNLRISDTTTIYNGSDPTPASFGGIELVYEESGGIGIDYVMPSIKFMATDPQITTESPKLLAAIVGRMTNFHNSDDDGGANIEFYTSPNSLSAGTTAITVPRMVVWDNGELTLADNYSNHQSAQSQGDLVMRKSISGDMNIYMYNITDSTTSSSTLELVNGSYAGRLRKHGASSSATSGGQSLNRTLFLESDQGLAFEAGNTGGTYDIWFSTQAGLAMWIDGSNPYVHIGGGTSPSEAMTVDGAIALDEISSPGTTSGYGKLYVGTDSELYFLDDSGNNIQITNVGNVNAAGLSNPYIAAFPKLRIENNEDNSGHDWTTSLSMPLIELCSAAATHLGTLGDWMGGIRWGQQDPNVTTESPKWVAGIACYSNLAPTVDSDAGAYLRFYTSIDGGGTANVLREQMRITDTDKVIVGGASTHTEYETVESTMGTYPSAFGVFDNVSGGDTGIFICNYATADNSTATLKIHSGTSSYKTFLRQHDNVSSATVSGQNMGSHFLLSSQVSMMFQCGDAGGTYDMKFATNAGLAAFVEGANSYWHFGGGTSPNEAVTINGALSLDEISAPGTSSGYGKIYTGTDSELHFLDDSGNDTQLTTAPSDRRLKTNIRPIEGALNCILAMNGVKYEWNEKAHEYSNRPLGVTEVGLIAQEVEEVVPELVKNGPTYKKLDYEKLTAVLVEAIKELKAEVDSLKSKLGDNKTQE